ncbi:MAG TPA: RNA 2',3'-cyclic phosphodiesterase [Candidatus Brocadiia bacterium]|nr:RNA 2',3'-cyclic phosphodiesterase [Candidatus Brocadiia bacterium]
MRAFLALEMSESIRQNLARLQSGLRPALKGVRWVEPQSLHLTLKFLGDVAGGFAEQAGPALAACAAAAPVSKLVCQGVGAFPDARRPRVVWVGLAEDPPMLAALSHALDRAAAAFGVAPEDKPFRAHVTIGRVKEPKPAPGIAAALAAQAGFVAGAMEAREIVLMKSDLRPAGPVYTPLARFALGGQSGGPRI